MSDNDMGQRATELRLRAEEDLRQSPQPLLALSPEETRRTLHELRVHQIELEMQNTELRRTQMELESERKRYFDLYEMAPVGYCTVSEEGLITRVNLSAADLLGITRDVRARRPIFPPLSSKKIKIFTTGSAKMSWQLWRPSGVNCGWSKKMGADFGHISKFPSAGMQATAPCIALF